MGGEIKKYIYSYFFITFWRSVQVIQVLIMYVTMFRGLIVLRNCDIYSFSFTRCTMHSVHCSMYSIQSTVNCTCVQFTVYSVHCTMFNMCTVYSGQCTMFSMCTVYSVQCTMFSMCTVYSVQCTMFSMCTAFSVQCTMFSM